MEVTSWRILVIEDNPADVGLLRMALEGAGLKFELIVLDDGAEALAFVRREPKYNSFPQPDLIVLDRFLPKNDSLEVLEAIGRSDALKGVPLVTMTSMASNDLPPHVDREILKPLTLQEYLNIGPVLKEILLQHRQGKAWDAIGL